MHEPWEWGSTTLDLGGDEGFSTAELLANAALAVGALVALWAALSGVGERVIQRIGEMLGV